MFDDLIAQLQELNGLADEALSAVDKFAEKSKGLEISQELLGTGYRKLRRELDSKMYSLEQGAGLADDIELEEKVEPQNEEVVQNKVEDKTEEKVEEDAEEEEEQEEVQKQPYMVTIENPQTGTSIRTTVIPASKPQPTTTENEESEAEPQPEVSPDDEPQTEAIPTDEVEFNDSEKTDESNDKQDESWVNCEGKTETRNLKHELQTDWGFNISDNVEGFYGGYSFIGQIRAVKTGVWEVGDQGQSLICIVWDYEQEKVIQLHPEDLQPIENSTHPMAQKYNPNYVEPNPDSEPEPTSEPTPEPTPEPIAEPIAEESSPTLPGFKYVNEQPAEPMKSETKFRKGYEVQYGDLKGFVTNGTQKKAECRFKGEDYCVMVQWDITNQPEPVSVHVLEVIGTDKPATSSSSNNSKPKLEQSSEAATHSQQAEPSKSSESEQEAITKAWGQSLRRGDCVIHSKYSGRIYVVNSISPQMAKLTRKGQLPSAFNQVEVRPAQIGCSLKKVGENVLDVALGKVK